MLATESGRFWVLVCGVCVLFVWTVSLLTSCVVVVVFVDVWVHAFPCSAL